LAAIHALPAHTQIAVVVSSLGKQDDGDFLIFLNDISDSNPTSLP
jgi:hypothetical protein